MKRYVRRKYIRLEGNGIAIGILPNRAIDKGMVAVGFLAAVKFICHASTGELTYSAIKLARLDIVVVTGRALPAITQRRE